MCGAESNEYLSPMGACSHDGDGVAPNKRKTESRDSVSIRINPPRPHPAKSTDTHSSTVWWFHRLVRSTRKFRIQI